MMAKADPTACRTVWSYEEVIVSGFYDIKRGVCGI